MWKIYFWLGIILGLSLLEKSIRNKSFKKRITNFLQRKKSSSQEVFKQKQLLSAAEENFFLTLRECLNESVTISFKVRLADLIESNDFGDFRRTSQKHIDFTLIDANSFEILGLIELDDKSHLRDNRQERDEFVDYAVESAGLSICHVRVTEPPDLVQKE